MIKFFRSIRQNLLNEGKTSKYLKYAIGEIVLVVIGILIALQINNWNETQKLIKQEEQILLELREELSNNVEAYKNILKRNNHLLKNDNDFLNRRNNQIIPPDSISKIINLFSYTPYLIEQPILNTILNSSDEKIIKHKFLLEDLRELKRRDNYVVQYLYYLDTFWNTNSANYLIKSGVGSSMGHDFKYDKPLILDEQFFSLLIMQKALLEDYIKVMTLSEVKSLEIINKIDDLLTDDKIL